MPASRWPARQRPRLQGPGSFFVCLPWSPLRLWPSGSPEGLPRCRGAPGHQAPAKTGARGGVPSPGGEGGQGGPPRTLTPNLTPSRGGGVKPAARRAASGSGVGGRRSVHLGPEAGDQQVQAELEVDFRVAFGHEGQEPNEVRELGRRERTGELLVLGS